jgi:hypothetical protein
VFDNHLGKKVEVDNDVCDAVPPQVLDRAFQDRLSADGDHTLGDALG